jgi:hypothetical protein
MVIPREHGAWSMLALPFISAALLARQWRWSVPVAALAAVAAFLCKEPLIVLARQRFVWTQPRSESRRARGTLIALTAILAGSGAVLAESWPRLLLLLFALGLLLFSALAVWTTLKNRQRSTVFQVISSTALTSSSLAACISATGGIESWCWWLWALSAANASAAILVVHSRMERRVALRKAPGMKLRLRAPAVAAQMLLLLGALVVAALGRLWIAAALLLSSGAHLWDLHQQRDVSLVKIPFRRVGVRALLLSVSFSMLVVAGLWH